MNDNYDDEQFEIDEPQPHSGLCSWEAISYDEIELGEQLGGGSMGLVHRGTYQGEPVAVKTLVSCTAYYMNGMTGDSRKRIRRSVGDVTNKPENAFHAQQAREPTISNIR